MMTFMRAGGYSMWIVLLFGIITVVTAAMFAYRPDEGRLGFVRAMTWAVVFATLSGVAADVAATFHKVANIPEMQQGLDIALYPMMGLSESMAPAILGFSMLGISWFITAIGIRRLSATP